MRKNVTALYCGSQKCRLKFTLTDPAPTPFHKYVSVHGCRHPMCNRRTGVADPSFSLRLIPKKSSEHQIHKG